MWTFAEIISIHFSCTCFNSPQDVQVWGQMNYRENIIWQHLHFNFCQLYQGTKVSICMLDGQRVRRLEKYTQTQNMSNYFLCLFLHCPTKLGRKTSYCECKSKPCEILCSFNTWLMVCRTNQILSKYLKIIVRVLDPK